MESRRYCRRSSFNTWINSSNSIAMGTAQYGTQTTPLSTDPQNIHMIPLPPTPMSTDPQKSNATTRWSRKYGAAEGAIAAARRGKEGLRFRTRPRGLPGSEAAFLELGAALPPRPALRRPRASIRSPVALKPHKMDEMQRRAFIWRRTIGSGVVCWGGQDRIQRW